MGVSIGIVGVGAFGREFVQLFRDHPGVDRVALADLDREKLVSCAREFGIDETCASLEELLASDIDAAAVITQPWLHAPQAVAAMEAGKDVYSAVPVISLPDGEEMIDWCGRVIDAVKRTGRIYMMGETSYYRPEAVYCRKRASAGAFGEFVYAEGEYLHDLSHGLYEVAKWRWGKDWSRAKSGGVPMHYPTHSAGGLMSVMNAHAVTVSALGYRFPDDDWFREDTEAGNVFSNEVALFRMSNGATARICEFRRVGHPGREAFRVYGTEASFEHDVSGAKWVTKSGWEKAEVEAARDPLPRPLSHMLGGHGGSHAYLVHEFVESVTSRRQPTVNAWEAARYLAAGVTAHRSALREGEVMKVPDWGDAPG